MPFRRMAVLILRAVKAAKTAAGSKKPGRRYRRQGQSCQRQGNTLCREYLTRKPGRENMWLFLWIRKNPFRQEGIPKTTMRRMRNESRNFVHGKIAETEKENSAVEGRTNQSRKGKNGFSFVKRQIKGKGQKQRAKVAKLEKSSLKRKSISSTRSFGGKSADAEKTLQKRLQKQRIKREYMKAREESGGS